MSREEGRGDVAPPGARSSRLLPIHLKKRTESRCPRSGPACPVSGRRQEEQRVEAAAVRWILAMAAIGFTAPIRRLRALVFGTSALGSTTAMDEMGRPDAGTHEGAGWLPRIRVRSRPGRVAGSPSPLGRRRRSPRVEAGQRARNRRDGGAANMLVRRLPGPGRDASHIQGGTARPALPTSRSSPIRNPTPSTMRLDLQRRTQHSLPDERGLSDSAGCDLRRQPWRAPSPRGPSERHGCLVREVRAPSRTALTALDRRCWQLHRTSDPRGVRIQARSGDRGPGSPSTTSAGPGRAGRRRNPRRTRSEPRSKAG